MLEKGPKSYDFGPFYMVREGGLDLPCGAGRVAALDCPRQSIHSRSRSSPGLCKTKRPPVGATVRFGARGGT